MGFENAYGLAVRKEMAKMAGVESIEDLDGIKYYFNADEWLMFRASGTEPLLRIYAESSSREKCRELIDAGKEVLGI